MHSGRKLTPASLVHYPCATPREVSQGEGSDLLFGVRYPFLSFVSPPLSASGLLQREILLFLLSHFYFHCCNDPLQPESVGTLFQLDVDPTITLLRLSHNNNALIKPLNFELLKSRVEISG